MPSHAALLMPTCHPTLKANIDKIANRTPKITSLKTPHNLDTYDPAFTAFKSALCLTLSFLSCLTSCLILRTTSVHSYSESLSSSVRGGRSCLILACALSSCSLLSLSFVAVKLSRVFLLTIPPPHLPHCKDSCAAAAPA